MGCGKNAGRNASSYPGESAETCAISLEFQLTLLVPDGW